MKTQLNTIPELLAELRQGRMVVLVDDEDRENEGDLVLPADFATPTAINFMATQARGLICLSLTSQQIDRLKLPQMVREDMNYSPNKTAFTVSIEAASGVSTGISASDRARTIQVAANPLSQPLDITSPGHIFPIRAQVGGVLKRAGHTEGSIDLCSLAGLNPAAVICEVMNEDGTMARLTELRTFAQKHNLKIGSIVDLIKYRLQNEKLVEEIDSVELSESFGKNLQLRVFRSRIDGLEHLVFQKGQIHPDQPILTRVHVEDSLKDVFCFLKTGDNHLYQAFNYLNKVDVGVVILLRRFQKHHMAAEARSLQLLTDEQWAMGKFMDEKDYGVGAQILNQLGVRQIRLLSNRADRRVGLKAFDLEIVEIVPFDILDTTEGEPIEKKEIESGRSYSTVQ